MKQKLPEIIRLTYGDTTLPYSWAVADGTKEKRIDIVLSVFLLREGERNILVDAGCETMPGFTVERFITPMDALREHALVPDDITDILLTHHHHDHIECARYFENAVVYIQKDEYEKAASYLTANEVVTFDEELALTPNIKIVKIGGHTTGSSVVECRQEKRTVVLCGDECYALENLEKRVPTASTVSPENSRKFIEKYSRPPYECRLCHQKGEEE